MAKGRRQWEQKKDPLPCLVLASALPAFLLCTTVHPRSFFLSRSFVTVTQSCRDLCLTGAHQSPWQLSRHLPGRWTFFFEKGQLMWMTCVVPSRGFVGSSRFSQARHSSGSPGVVCGSLSLYRDGQPSLMSAGPSMFCKVS